MTGMRRGLGINGITLAPRGTDFEPWADDDELKSWNKDLYTHLLAYIK